MKTLAKKTGAPEKKWKGGDVKVFILSDDEKRLKVETEMKMTDANMKIYRKDERFRLVFASPSGGTEIDMPATTAARLKKEI
jgi:hypothetical protein